MQLRPLLLAAAVSATLAAGHAHAVTFESASTAGTSTVTDFSADGLIAFDLDLRDLLPLTLNFRVTAADLAAPTLDFNSVVRNLTGAVAGLQTLRFDLAGTTLAAAGTVTRFFGGTTQSFNTPAAISMAFTPAEYFDVELGNAFGSTPMATNWKLSTAGLREGDQIRLVAVVPEPASLALMALGLLGVGAVARRRVAR